MRAATAVLLLLAVAKAAASVDRTSDLTAPHPVADAASIIDREAVCAREIRSQCDKPSVLSRGPRDFDAALRKCLRNRQAEGRLSGACGDAVADRAAVDRECRNDRATMCSKTDAAEAALTCYSLLWQLSTLASAPCRAAMAAAGPLFAYAFVAMPSDPADAKSFVRRYVSARHSPAFVVRNQHGRAQHSSNDARVVRTKSVEGVVLEREWSPPGA
jgi:hypothetical protein